MKQLNETEPLNVDQLGDNKARAQVALAQQFWNEKREASLEKGERS
jgi:hypothetical protein